MILSQIFWGFVYVQLSFRIVQEIEFIEYAVMKFDFLDGIIRYAPISTFLAWKTKSSFAITA